MPRRMRAAPSHMGSSSSSLADPQRAAGELRRALAGAATASSMQPSSAQASAGRWKGGRDARPRGSTRRAGRSCPRICLPGCRPTPARCLARRFGRRLRFPSAPPSSVTSFLPRSDFPAAGLSWPTSASAPSARAERQPPSRWREVEDVRAACPDAGSTPHKGFRAARGGRGLARHGRRGDPRGRGAPAWRRRARARCFARVSESIVVGALPEAMTSDSRRSPGGAEASRARRRICVRAPELRCCGGRGAGSFNRRGDGGVSSRSSSPVRGLRWWPTPIVSMRWRAGRRCSSSGEAPTILTPHPGEAARQLGRSSKDIQADRLSAVRMLARRSHAVVVLKGSHTLIGAPSGEVVVNATGTPLLSTAGSGDVLAGLIGALCAGGLRAIDSAVAGAWLHGARPPRRSRRGWGTRVYFPRSLTRFPASGTPCALQPLR